ncbi:MAG: hypothetical protein AAGA90_04835 [Actinomycetota bacterium]
MNDLLPAHRAWIEEALTRLGATAHGPAVATKIRPWSSVGRIDTDRGRLWFKANEPALAFEAELLVVLAHAAPGRVLKPLERDPATGWFLLTDGGPTADGGDMATAEAITAIVEVQRAGAHRIDDAIRAGTPDRRPSVLRAVLDAAIAHPSSGVGGERCAAIRDRFVDGCALLEADGRSTIVNADHKPAHLFRGPPLRIFDWGDAAVSHPLADLPFIEREFGAAAAVQLLDAWGVGPSDAIVAAAGAAGELIEADVWLRTSPEGLARHPDGIDVALGRLADRIAASP